MTRAILQLTSVVLLAVGLFYAFNAYIQFQERGFAETTDVPIAVVALVIGALLAWRSWIWRR
jgi:hypothetical protein